MLLLSAEAGRECLCQSSNHVEVMKKNFALLMLVGSLATQAYAAPLVTPKSKALKATLGQQLANYISYPDVLNPTRQAGIVVIQFRVNAESQLGQLKVFSQNEQLNNTLLRQLTGKKIKGYNGDTGELHTVRLHFKLN